ncbi:hypothetical protein GQ600_13996 [Phytophthora cactorum]|nr:hypothetical protein GQ600_13996 [Phytophthora cactorum]
MQLPQFVRLLRGETACDPRPNKAFEIPPASPAWLSYQYRRQWEAIVRHAVRPNWKSSFQQQGKPAKNHASARFAINALGKQVRKGQDAWHYLVLDTELLPIITGPICMLLLPRNGPINLPKATKFAATTWGDDHHLIEPDIGSILFEANLVLRHAMTTILGPEATNEETFTVWDR